MGVYCRVALMLLCGHGVIGRESNVRARAVPGDGCLCLGHVSVGGLGQLSLTFNFLGEVLWRTDLVQRGCFGVSDIHAR